MALKQQDGFTIQGASTNPSLPPFAALGAGIWTNPSFSATQGGHQILNNIVQNNIIGVYLNNNGTLQTVVRHNLFRNNNLTGPAGGNSIYTDLGLENAVIDANTFTGDPSSGVFAAGAFGTQSNITISNNTAINERLVVLFSTTSSVISGNTVMGAPQSSGITIAGGVDGVALRGNAIINNVNLGIRIGDFIGGSPNANIAVSHNRIVGNPAGGLLVETGGHTGTVDAQNNWWGCNAGPGLSGCDTATAVDVIVDSNPWLVLALFASPSMIAPGGVSGITADLNFNSDGVNTLMLGSVPNNTPAAFGATLGTINPTNTTFTAGQANAAFTAGGVAGTATISVTVDNQAVSTPVIIDAALGFDICVQDDSSKSFLKFNSTTGVYEFLDCRRGTVLTGQGTVTRLGCKIMLSDKGSKSPPRNVSALVNVCTFAGEANLMISNVNVVLRGRDTRDNTCTCP